MRKANPRIGHSAYSLLVIAGCAATAAVPAWSLLHATAGVLAGFGGALVGWAIVRQALANALRGALVGAVFLAIVGPVADRWISGRPVIETLASAATVGMLVGAAHGIRNTKSPKRPQPAHGA